MNASEGFLTAFGGMTSHAALVARQMGKVSIVGCDALSLRLPRAHHDRGHREGHRVLKEGDWISIDGSTGEVIEGRLETSPSEVIQVLIEKNRDPKDAPVYQEFAALMGWADAVRRLKVRANADQPDQAAAAVAFGAEGIGLCRTEHMFFGEGKIGPMREMIVADNDERAPPRALAKLLPLQREDFGGIFQAMDGRPVTIRTLDPPLHEFLPHDEAGVRRAGRGHRQDASRASRPGSRSCTNRTRCSATAAAASASPTPRSPRCRPAPSSRPPSTWPRRASRSSPRS